MADYNKEYRNKVVIENLIEKGKGTRITPDRVFEMKRKYGKPIPEIFIKKEL